MIAKEVYEYLLKQEIVDNEISLEPISLEIEETTLFQILKDIIDTSWGRGKLDSGTINRWLNNFTGLAFDSQYERKLALILAIHIVYYNENDISYLVKIAYRRLLHEIMIKDNTGIEGAMQSIMFYPLGSVSESGPFMSYYFRKENGLSTDFFISSMDELFGLSKVKNIVLLDDVSISGGQAIWYMKDMKKKVPLWDDLVRDKNIYALFLISTITAQEKLAAEKIKLCTPILMDERSQCFKEESTIYRMFDKDIRNIIRLQSRYMAEKYGYKLLSKQYFYNGEIQRLLDDGKSADKIRDKVRKDALGYNGSQVLLAFEYNTPNNCLPIIWVDNEDWVPLFKRHDKLYTAQIVGGIESETIYV